MNTAVSICFLYGIFKVSEKMLRTYLFGLKSTLPFFLKYFIIRLIEQANVHNVPTRISDYSTLHFRICYDRICYFCTTCYFEHIWPYISRFFSSGRRFVTVNFITFK